MSRGNPFEFRRRESVDEPGIVGAVWWNDAVRVAGNKQSRRTVLGVMAAAGGVLAVFGLVSASCGDDDDDTSTRLETALDVQRDYGWRFGATARSLAYSSPGGTPIVSETTRRIANVLAPKSVALRPFALRTLLDAPEAVPRKALPEPEAAAFVPLWREIQQPPAGAGNTFFAIGRNLGRALAAAVGATRPPSAPSGAGPSWGTIGSPAPGPSALAKPNSTGAAASPATTSTPPVSSGTSTPPPASSPAQAPKREAIVVDLPGRQAVGFAAGAAEFFEPILLVDNWPHPLGVVPSHEVLGELARYLPELETAKAQRSDSAPPLFVLASERLAAYSADAESFDNRYLAKLPSAAALKNLGIGRVNYVVANAQGLPETGDLTEDFLAYVAAGIEVRALLGLDPDPLAAPPAYRPTARVTSHGKGVSREDGFGKVAVLVAVGTGLVVGAKMIRSGSLNRSSGWNWGGG